MPLDLPCGKCIGCREAKAKAWALRCTLELQQHRDAVFTTLTYNDENRPSTLSKRDLQGFFKRLRKRLTRSDPTRTIRFFACGEYGDRTKREHYHALVFGMAKHEERVIQTAWGNGNAVTEPITPERIAYTAGYVGKKYGQENRMETWRMPEGEGVKKITGYIDEETGEWQKKKPTTGKWKPEIGWYWQEPFLQMSTKPGIGGFARQKYTNSWRKCAVLNGTTQAVPRYLHEAWKEKATPEQLEKLEEEKYEIMKEKKMTKEQRIAAEIIHKAKHRMKDEKRSTKI